MTDKIIATLPKNSNERLQVTLTEFHGHRLASARVFYDAGGGEWRPGKAGLNIRVEQLPGLIAALQIAAREAGV